MLALAIAAGGAVPVFVHAVDGGPWVDLPELAGLGVRMAGLVWAIGTAWAPLRGAGTPPYAEVLSRIGDPAEKRRVLKVSRGSRQPDVDDDLQELGQAAHQLGRQSARGIAIAIALLGQGVGGVLDGSSSFQAVLAAASFVLGVGAITFCARDRRRAAAFLELTTSR